MVVAAIRMTRPPTAIGAAENTDLQLNLVSILAWAHRLGPQLLTLVREAVLSWPHPLSSTSVVIPARCLHDSALGIVYLPS